jgi:hypothetical protein
MRGCSSELPVRGVNASVTCLHASFAKSLRAYLAYTHKISITLCRLRIVHSFRCGFTPFSKFSGKTSSVNCECLPIIQATLFSAGQTSAREALYWPDLATPDSAQNSSTTPEHHALPAAQTGGGCPSKVDNDAKIVCTTYAAAAPCVCRHASVHPLLCAKRRGALGAASAQQQRRARAHQHRQH